MKSLLISLGHGASAVLVIDNEIVAGYENERLSKVKSDSKYPVLAIEELDDRYNLFDVDEVMISHWFIDGRLPRVPNKYYNGMHLERMCPSAKVMTTNIDFTHHDAHMYSAKLFAGPAWMNSQNVLGIVCDGFGTMGETLSVYDCNRGNLRIMHRSFGFSTSLGLLYQYATSFLGMKENQDEYKLLGYEPSVHDHFGNDQLDVVNEWSDYEVKRQLKDISTYKVKAKFDPLCTIDALPALKMVYRDHFKSLFSALGITEENTPEHYRRALIAYYVQKRVEDTLYAVIKGQMKDRTQLLLTGGVFMNVKLNNRLLELADSVCIMPLCGDQGAPLGIYEAAHPGEMRWPDHLFWGKRDLNIGLASCPPGMFYLYPSSGDDIADFIAKNLNAGKIVNLVRGDMEYGSRALCNTTTLALPTKENVEYINTANARSTIMPMAPVMGRETARVLFSDHEFYSVHKSLEYMICTLKYKPKHEAYYIGAAHNIPGTSEYSGRPQITDEKFMLEILKNVDGAVLINTSFNIHGQPIVFDMADVIKCHEFQKDRDPDNRIITVVIGEEDGK